MDMDTILTRLDDLTLNQLIDKLYAYSKDKESILELISSKLDESEIRVEERNTYTIISNSVDNGLVVVVNDGVIARGSGKTRTTIELAKEEGYIPILRNQWVKRAVEEYPENKGLMILSADRIFHGMNQKGRKYIVDEISPRDYSVLISNGFNIVGGTVRV